MKLCRTVICDSVVLYQTEETACSCEPQQHRRSHDEPSCPRLVSVTLSNFTVSQLPVKSTGIMYRMRCAVQELILHTTSLIPIERPVIPHLQSQISPQSSLLFCHHYSLCNISSKISLWKKSCKPMEIQRQFMMLIFKPYPACCACCMHCRESSGLVSPKC